MRTTPQRLIIFVALLATAVACSSGSRPSLQGGSGVPTVTAVRDATAAAGPVRYEGTLVRDGRSGALTGVSGAQPRQGEVTVPVFTGDAVESATIRWLDDWVYIERIPVQTRSATAVAALFERDPSDRPWARYGLNTIVGAALAAFDPLRLLDNLVTAEAGLESDGEEDIAGVRTTRYRVTASGGASSSSTAELWIDADLRLRRVRAETPAFGTTDYTVTELGAALSVEVPAAELLADQTADPRALSTVKPAGPYEPVRAGTTEGVRWTLLRAPGTNGGVCWRFEAEPPLTQVSEAFAPFPDGGRCVGTPTVSSELDLDERIAVVVDADGLKTTYDAVVLALPADVASVEMAGPGGVLTPVEIDRATGTVVWVSPLERPGLLAVVHGEGGQTAICAPGPITEVDDLLTLDEQEIANLQTQIWSCLPG
jgi:hypothetical protein